MDELFSERAEVVHTTESPEPGGHEHIMRPEERAHIAGASPGRVAHFALGRWCARQALVALGAEPVAIPVGERRQPVWPAGVRFSIRSVTTPEHGAC